MIIAPSRSDPTLQLPRSGERESPFSVLARPWLGSGPGARPDRLENRAHRGNRGALGHGRSGLGCPSGTVETIATTSEVRESVPAGCLREIGEQIK